MEGTDDAAGVERPLVQTSAPVGAAVRQGQDLIEAPHETISAVPTTTRAGSASGRSSGVMVAVHSSGSSSKAVCFTPTPRDRVR